MRHSQWTILIVPPGNKLTWSFRFGRRARRALIVGAGIAAILVTSAIVLLFAPWATPGTRLLVAENQRLRGALAHIDERLTALNDTLVSLGQRDQQIRLLAGLPVDATPAEPSTPGAESEHALGGALALADDPSELPKPLSRPGAAKHTNIDGMIERAAQLSASFRAVSDTLTRNFERLSSMPSIMPTVGWLSSHFSQSRFHPVLHTNLPHEGIDVSAPMGAPIVAPAGGRVKSVTYEPGYGRTFEIDHGNGIVTKFAHCSRIVVRAGQAVTRGQVIATVGNSGLSTGPHLHYEVHVNGMPVDPLKYVLPEKVAD